ncbi:hypothetical protein Ancab_006867 [Ancistrocladus abbreviatus]
MQNQAPTAAASPSSSARYGEERVAGGKFRRPPSRKVPSTPYDRPRNQQQRQENSGWLSKIVNPARRLIAGGATRLLPSLFSSSSSVLPSSTSTIPPPPLTDVADEGHAKMKQEMINDSSKSPVNINTSKSTVVVGPSKLGGKSEVSVSAQDGQEKIGEAADDSQLSEIERLIEGKTFCREEINHLMEIIKARVVDVEQERKVTSEKATVKVDRLGTSSEKLKNPVKEKPEDLDIIRAEASTPLPQATNQEQIGASPVEVARAYMGSRASEIAFGSKSSIARDGGLSLHGDEQAKNALLRSPLPKPSICWPGAVVEDHPGYSTPHSQIGKFGLQTFPRTPYSRVLYSKSKSKLTPLRGDSGWLPNNSSTPFLAMQTPVYGQSKINVEEDCYGSVGPIRRMRNKYASQTPTRGSTLSRSLQKSPLQLKESDDHDFVPKKAFEPGSSSTSAFQSVEGRANNSEVGSPSVHLSSSKVARQILDLISKPATLKEKSEELKLVTARSNPSSSEPLSAIPNKPIVLPQTRGNSFFKVPPQVRRAEDVSVAAKDAAPALKTSLESPSVPAVSTTMNSENANASQVKSLYEATNKNDRKGEDQLWPFSNQSKGLNVTINPPAGSGALNGRPVSSGAKPVLPTISVDKSRLQPSIASDGSIGFTFPVTASSNSFSEPPTPSLMPSSSPIPLRQSDSTFIPPTYSFGNKKSNPPIVFSFPSTSAASTPNDAPEIKFKFGSNEKRISFRAIGKDAVSC